MIPTVIADAGHESRKLARTLRQHQGWQLRIVKRRQRAFKITGLTWIVERSFAWLGRLETGARQFRSRDKRSAKAARVSVRVRYRGLTLTGFTMNNPNGVYHSIVRPGCVISEASEV